MIRKGNGKSACARGEENTRADLDPFAKEVFGTKRGWSMG